MKPNLALEYFILIFYRKKKKDLRLHTCMSKNKMDNPQKLSNVKIKYEINVMFYNYWFMCLFSPIHLEVPSEEDSSCHQEHCLAQRQARNTCQFNF